MASNHFFSICRELAVRTSLFLVSTTAKPEAVCRAGCRGGWSRCAVRMTAKGSVTPWMACGSRPEEDDPKPGAVPAVGINPKARGQGGMALCPLAAPANGRLANRPSRQGGTGSNRIQIRVSASTVKGENRHAVNVGLRPTQPDLRLKFIIQIRSRPPGWTADRPGAAGRRSRCAVRMTAKGNSPRLIAKIRIKKRPVKNRPFSTC